MVLRGIFKVFIDFGWYWPFLIILKNTIREHEASRRHANPARPTILGLSPEFFRSDLDILAASGDFRVLLMPFRWQTRLMYLFYPENRHNWEILNPLESTDMMECKKRILAFYDQLVPRVHRMMRVDAVVSHHVRAPADVDWGIASKRSGVPYIILYREGMFASNDEIKDRMRRRFKKLGFWGSHMVVHNNSSRDFCIETGVFKPEQVSALGCLRMDEFASRAKIAREADSCKSENLLAVFPFTVQPDGEGVLDLSFEQLFHDSNLAILQLAQVRQDFQILIKPKPKDFEFIAGEIAKIAEKAGINLNQLRNVTISSELDAQELILKADVITGLNSTTVLEAILTPKAVVVPFFKEYRTKEGKRRVKFIDALECMDVADDADDFKRILESRMGGYRVSDETMEKRRFFFSKYVSDPDGRALEQYRAYIKNEIERSDPKRMDA